MNFKNKPNPSYLCEDGIERFFSRSIAVCVILRAYNPHKSKYYYLITQRSSDMMDSPNKWCFPCGYLDFNETVEEAAIRECYEETGLEVYIKPSDLVFVNSSPSENRQNVTFRYLVTLPWDDIWKFKLTDEVQDIKLVTSEESELHPMAFNHDKLIKHYEKRRIDNCGSPK